MDGAFEAHDCHLEKIDGKKRTYTRDVDDKDLESDAEKDWLEDIRIRRSHRAGVQEIISDMKNVYGDNPEYFLEESSECSDIVKRLLSETPYQIRE